MKLAVIVKTNSKKPRVERMPDGTYRVHVNASPADGKANVAVIEALASFLAVPKSSIKMVKGFRGKKKLFEVGG